MSTVAPATQPGVKVSEPTKEQLSFFENKIRPALSVNCYRCHSLESGKSKLLETRTVVQRGWRATSDILTAQGHVELADQVRRFVDQMPPPLTEREQLARPIRRHLDASRALQSRRVTR